MSEPTSAEKLAIVYNHFTLEEWMSIAEGVLYLQPLGLLTGEEISEILKKLPSASLPIFNKEC